MPASLIEGSTALPPGYAHPHASEEARRIAERGTFLRCQVGSGVHGTAIDGQDDRDELGICLEPPQFVTGLARVPSGVPGSHDSVAFEQYERHTAWQPPGGLANRSGPGELDVIVYSARKWARLALDGNPTVLLVLFAPDRDVVCRNACGAELVDNADRFVSRLAARRFLGYLQSQKAAMTDSGGYDPKRAMHALRLGVQGVELLTEGQITLPLPSWHRDYLVRVRRGEVERDDVVAAVNDAEARLVSLRDNAGVPAQPDRAWADAWLHRAYLDYWARMPYDGTDGVRDEDGVPDDGDGNGGPPPGVTRRSSQVRAWQPPLR